MSGIFLNEGDTENCFRLISGDIRNGQIIKSVNFEKYLVYLVEAEEYCFVYLEGLCKTIWVFHCVCCKNNNKCDCYLKVKYILRYACFILQLYKKFTQTF